MSEESRQVDRQIDKYRLLEEVGHGGMSVVYRGLDTLLNREVAVKVLHPHLSADRESRQRLQREAQAVAKLRHENILEIFDYSGPASSEGYIVTEFIHGDNLASFLDKHAIPYPEVAVMIVVEVCRALAHAHALGVIHRDIKPENIMIRDDGLLKLTDFGIAQVVDSQRMTTTGQLLGSPAYMAPEHVDGKTLDFRSDVFSVGTLLYQLATAHLPFEGRNPHEVLKRIAEARFADPRTVNPAVSDRLAATLRHALARRPEERFADVTTMLDELLALLGELDIDEPRAELAQFFASPDEYAEGFRGRLLAALLRAAEAARAAGKLPQALDLLNRAMDLSPDDPALAAVLRRLSRRSRVSRWTRRVAAGAAFATALVVVAWLAVASLGTIISGGSPVDAGGRPQTELAPVAGRPDAEAPLEVRPTAAGTAPLPSLPPLPPAADAGTATTPATAGAAGAGDAAARKLLAMRALVSERQVAEPRLRPRHLMAPPAATIHRRRQIEIVPVPKAVEIFLDGRRLGWYGDIRQVDIPPGEHALRFENPGCFPREIRIRPQDDPRTLTVRLQWKPAILVVRGAPGADVLVDGRMSGRAGDDILIPIPRLNERGQATVKVTVAIPGRGTVSRHVAVTGGRTTELPIDGW